MTMQDESSGEIYAPGSPEDVMQIMKNLNQFFTNKLRDIEMYQQGGQGMRPNETTGTRSVCHIDGVDDGDSWPSV